MRYPSRIYLIGMPASGKTTFGKRLAQHLNFNFLDLDQQIEDNTKQRIPFIFSKLGEEYFRKEEQKALHQTFALENTVIATGGGAPCFFDNVEQMKQQGLVCLLDVPLCILAKRAFEVSQKGHSRPLLDSAQSLENYEKLIADKWEVRKQHYQQAHFSITQLDFEEQLKQFQTFFDA